MRVFHTAFAAFMLSAAGASAATTTFEIQVDASIGFNTPVERYTIGLTYDPDAITPTLDGNFPVGRVVEYGSVDGFLRKGAETAQISNIRVNFTRTFSNLSVLGIVLTLDDGSLWGPAPAGLPAGFYDGDTDDGLTYDLTTGAPSGIDVNSLTFSFGSRGANPFPSPYLGDDFDALATVQFTSIAGSVFGVVNGRGGPGNATLFDGITGGQASYVGWSVAQGQGGGQTPTGPDVTPVPLPAAGWLLAGALLAVGGVARRR